MVARQKTAAQRNAAMKKRTEKARINGRLGKERPATKEALRLKSKYAKESKKSTKLLDRASLKQKNALKVLHEAKKKYKAAQNATKHARFAATSNAQLANRYARTATGAVNARRAYNEGARTALNSRTNATHRRLTRAATTAGRTSRLAYNHVLAPYAEATFGM